MDNLNYDNFDHFQKRIGLIDDAARLEAIGAPKYFDENGYFDYDKEFFAQMDKFLSDNPQYHLATLTSDSDESESDEVKRIWLIKNPDKTADDYEKLCELDDDFYENFRAEYPVFVTTIQNCRRFVDRLGFYLCDGDRDENIFLTEINREFDDSFLQVH